MPITPPLRLVCAFAVPAAVAVAGCRDSGSAQAGPPAAAVLARAHGGALREVTADPSGALSFSPSTLSAKAGKVTLVMRNPSSTGEEHGIAVAGRGVNRSGAIVGPGGTSAVAVRLTRGTYELYCPFDHHAQDGMTGTLTVR